MTKVVILLGYDISPAFQDGYSNIVTLGVFIQYVRTKGEGVEQKRKSCVQGGGG